VTGSGIVVRDIVKNFGSIRALDGVSLDVEPGQVVTLLGQNGAGKSTLMRILATIVTADEGTASVAGNDVMKSSRAARAAVGLALADERSLYWRLSGRRNLEYFAALHGMARRAAKAESERLLGIVDLLDSADRMVAGYSTGMRARLVIARSLLGNPKVLLFDEPTRSLDPIASRGVRALVSELTRVDDLAILYATHDLHEAAEIGSRSLIIDRGAIVATASAGIEAAALERLLVEAAA